jgi:hypothetical protein
MIHAYPKPTAESWAMRSFRLSLMMPIVLVFAAGLTVVLG